MYREKNQQAYAVTNSSELKEVTWNKTAEPSDLFYQCGFRSSALKSIYSSRHQRLLLMSWLAFSVQVELSASHTNQSQSGPWWVATQCSPPRSHPTSRRSGNVRVRLDLAEVIFCCAHCQQMQRLQSLRIHSPLPSIFLDFWQL